MMSVKIVEINVHNAEAELADFSVFVTQIVQYIGVSNVMILQKVKVDRFRNAKQK
jgi:hypothetical protein